MYQKAVAEKYEYRKNRFELKIQCEQGPTEKCMANSSKNKTKTEARMYIESKKSHF